MNEILDDEMYADLTLTWEVEKPFSIDLGYKFKILIICQDFATYPIFANISHNSLPSKQVVGKRRE